MTTSVRDLQNLVDRIKSGKMPIIDLRGLLYHQSPLIRANALEALVDGGRHDEESLQELIDSVLAPLNRVVLMGTISVAHIAMGCLIQVGTARAVEAAEALLESWPEPDRADLIWYLNSRGRKGVIASGKLEKGGRDSIVPS